MPPADPQKTFGSALFAAVIGGCFCVSAAVTVWALCEHPVLNNDFRGVWSFASFARHRQVGQIYQAAALQAFQRQIYPGFRSFFPFQYPPAFLLAVWPLGGFTYGTSQCLWTVTGVAALIGASWIFFPPQQRRLAILALLAAPASLLNGVAGETGFFTAAMLLAGFAWLPSRPVLAGICFGLLTIKPQLGVLIVFALLAPGNRPAITAAWLSAMVLAVLSCILLPPRLWAEWLHAVPVYQGQYLAAAKSLGLNADVTLGGNLSRLGLAAGIAWGAQALAGLGGGAAVFFAFRHGPYRLAVAALLAGSCVCAPHACAYDSIPLTAAILLLQPRSGLLISLCLLIYLAPYLLLTGAASWFLYAFPETLLFIAIIYLAMTTERPTHIRHEPDPAAKSYPKQR
jgi:hypothetical protein